MKKSVLCIFLAIVMLTGMTSCSLFKGPITDEELVEIVAPLLEKDALLSGYIWGNSFDTSSSPSEEDIEARTPIYYAVSLSSPYRSVEELRAAAEELYSADLMVIVNQYAFENSDTIMARFCDDVDDNGKVTGLRIDITHNHTPYNLTAVAYVNTAVVKRSTKTMIEGEIEITAGASERRSVMEIRLLKEGDAWKLDTQTWICQVSYE